MIEELKPCPFCGEKPALPDGDGTQYEIECGGCGQAMASVQICDLMTIEERAAEEFTNYRYAEEFVERAKVEAIANWNRRAQPAEAEVASIPLTGEYHIDCGYLMNLVDDQRAALSAVTAERDRLQGEIQSLRGSMEFRSSLIGRTEAERDLLRAEAEALRKDAERYRMFRHGMFDPDRFDADIDAAMAAKDKP